MAKIFINYRSSDTADFALHLDKRLCEAFGAEAVFRDDRAIPFSRDYRDFLWGHLATSKVVLVLIGRHWLEHGDKGIPRLHEEDDFVRLELEKALDLRLDVAPVLVGISGRLNADDLPDSLKPLAYRQYRQIRQRSADLDIDALVADVGEMIGQQVRKNEKWRRPRPTFNWEGTFTNNGVASFGDNNTSHQYKFGQGDAQP